eukprot:TRINITY_DN132_c2_g5_i2.p1 TRINITY_DN132_c2_g5~~TRINITY_DN132_c2_g5_i2.p1  ORF type:complete len:1362 (+),score=679.08 TRINITY_DN132_c2_g5_i2:279-4364(+)
MSDYFKSAQQIGVSLITGAEPSEQSEETEFLSEKELATPKFENQDQSPDALREYILKRRERTGLGQLGLYVSVRNLSVSVVTDEKQKKEKETRRLFAPKSKIHLLDDISFALKPGMMVLVLGTPGSGKSVLFKTLSNRMKSAKMDGELLFNGKRPNRKTHHHDVALSSQYDIHLPTMTVRETIEFSAELRMHKNLSKEQRSEAIEGILNMLGLKHVENTIVGNTLLRGVSGGEKRRVSIGVEMVQGCNLLLLDEPTTGLDSSAAMDVLKHIRILANAGMTVMCILLQPGPELFSLFDHVMILSQGKLVYFGTQQDSVPYFENLGFSSESFQNPAEFLQEVTETPAKFSKTQPPPLVTSDDFAIAFKRSPQFDAIQQELGVSSASIPANITLDDGFEREEFSVPVVKQFALVLTRGFKTVYRNKLMNRGRILRSLLLSLILGTSFLLLGDGQRDSQNKLSLLFFSVAVFSMSSITAIPGLFEEREVFYEQKLRKYYNSFVYVASSFICDFPVALIETILFGTIMYWMTGLNVDVVRFIYCLLALMSTNLASMAFCKMCAACSPTLGIATGIAPTGLAVMILFSGYLIPGTDMPVYWVWLNYLSLYKYPYEGLLVNEFDDAILECKEGETVPPPYYPTANLSYEQGGFNYSTTCPYETGDDFLRGYDLPTDSTTKWFYLLVICAMYLFFAFISFLALRFIVHEPVRSAPRKEVDRSDKLGELSARYGSLLLRHQSMQTQGIYLSFQNLSYTVQEKGKPPKKLLNEVSGYVKPGMMLALMGASGAGKTTLLDVLANRKTGGIVEGSLLVNGRPRDKYFARYSGYVEQQNIHIATQTVREAIFFSAMCRLPKEVPEAEKIRFAESVIDILDLRPIVNSQIGKGQDGLSPEQKKRVTIGVELASNPSLLFLDEPTSGLDSAAADKVMTVVKRIAGQGRSVICTIHQPSAQIFAMFNQLLLLKRGGEVVYFGQLDQDYESMFTYFRNALNQDCPKGKNPADFVLDLSGAGIGLRADALMAGDPNDPEFLNPNGGIDPSLAYKQSELHRKNIEELQIGITPPDFQPNIFTSIYASSYGTMCWQTIKRGMISYVRDPGMVRVRVIRSIIIALVMGTLCWRMGNTQQDARNEMAIIFFMILSANMGSVSSIPTIIEERAAYYRERAAGTYRAECYLYNIVIREIPFCFLTMIFLVIPLYWMTGLNPNASIFFQFIFNYLLMICTMTAYAQFLGIIAPTIEVANLLSGLSNTMFSLFAGFMLPKNSIPVYWIWMYYIDIAHYPLESLACIQFNGENFTCAEGEGYQVPVPLSNGSYANQTYCPIQSGDQIIIAFDLNPENKVLDITILLAIYFIFIFFSFLGLIFVKNLKR